MDNLFKHLRQEWYKKFGSAWSNDRREIRLEWLEGERWFFRVSHSSAFEQWNSNPLRKSYEAPGCFFCARHDEYHVLEKVVYFGGLNVFYNAKFVAPCHYLMFPDEHRQDPSAQDVISLSGFSQEAVLAVFGNLKDAGASYARHVHYQPIDDQPLPGEEFKISPPASRDKAEEFLAAKSILPIKAMSDVEIFSANDISLRRVDWPIAAYFFEYGGERGCCLAAAAVIRAGKPFNLMFSGQRVYLIPRVKSFSELADGFKIATAEVCGCFFTRKREHFGMIDGQLAVRALHETGLPSSSRLAAEYEKRLIEITKEVC